MITYYYTAIKTNSGYVGRIYHYTEKGNKTVGDWIGPHRNSREEAIDDASEQADKMGIDVELDYT